MIIKTVLDYFVSSAFVCSHYRVVSPLLLLLTNFSSKTLFFELSIISHLVFFIF
jgi:hypothetical protein